MSKAEVSIDQSNWLLASQLLMYQRHTGGTSVSGFCYVQSKNQLYALCILCIHYACK